MKLSRREALRLGLLAGATTATVGCSRLVGRVAGPTLPDSIELPTGNLDPTLRLCNRVSFGPSPGELSRIAKMGPEAYIEEQLRADRPEDLSLQFMVRRSDPFQMTDIDLQDLPDANVLRQLQQAAILRAVYSKNQLKERMVDFWTNHFNLYARKGYTVDRVGPDQNNVVREHALGKFSDLLRASAHSPGMLVYLDNQVNRKGVPNENYAREIMELHTLGVNGGYTIGDIQEVARCFTGWSIEGRFLHRRGTFLFREDLHDKGEKSVLGHKIPANRGIEDGEQVLAILSNHPSTAHFIAGKLCKHFVGEGQPKLVGQIADIFLKTNGDIKSMMRAILSSQELLNSAPILKRPFDYIVSSLRALNATTDGDLGVQAHLEQMGQPLYQWPMPDGYPDKTSSWTGTLLARWNFAYALAHQRIQGTSVDHKELQRHHRAQGPEGVAELVLGRRPSSPEAQSISTMTLKHSSQAPRGLKKDPSQVAAALCLASPEFQWR